MGQLLSFLDKTRKTPGYLPTGEVFIVDADDIAALQQLKRLPFVADVSSTFDGKTTVKRRLIIGQDEILVDRSTSLALNGHDLTKVTVDLNSITITIWEPNAELAAKGFKPSKQASFDFDIKA